MAVVVPVAKTLFLCGDVTSVGRLRNLYGVYHQVRPKLFPHTRDLVAFAQLGEGLGEVSVHVDVRRAADGHLLHSTPPLVVRFQRRTQIVQLVLRVTNVRFPAAGVYLVELYGNNTWVGDVRLELLEVTDVS